MNKIVIGNFEGQANRQFPADCELFSSLQANTSIIAVIGNIAGDKAILKGCELEKNNTSRKEGYVFIRTKDYPNGEVLFWQGGSIAGGMYVKLEVVAITAQDCEYENAYTVRSLVPGVGVENYNWSDFHSPKSLKEIEQIIKELNVQDTFIGFRIDRQDAAIANLHSIPIGTLQLWGGLGASLPDGHMWCRGQWLVRGQYPELFDVVSIRYDLGGTPSDCFSLPIMPILYDHCHYSIRVK